MGAKSRKRNLIGNETPNTIVVVSILDDDMATHEPLNVSGFEMSDFVKYGAGLASQELLRRERITVQDASVDHSAQISTSGYADNSCGDGHFMIIADCLVGEPAVPDTRLHDRTIVFHPAVLGLEFGAQFG